MEYGIWGLHAAGGLWGDPRLARRHHRPILQSGTSAPGILPIIAFGAHSQPPHPVSQWQHYEGAMELTAKKSSTVTWSDDDETEHPRDDNSVGKWRNDGSTDENDDKTIDKVTNEEASHEKEEEEEDEDEETEEEEEEDCNDQQSRQTSLVGSICNNERESDDENEGSGSRQSANNNFSSKLMPTDPMSRLIGFDKEENVSPVLNNWVLGAYTAMIGRLTAAAAAAALEASQVPMTLSSNSDSESESSSSSSSSVASSSLSSTASSRIGSKMATTNPGSHRGGYSCGTCDTVVPTRTALRKHIIEAHRGSLTMQKGSSTCPSTGCEFTSNSGCEMESHVAAHVVAHVSRVGPTTAKKSSLALQRVRYRYEREEYRCSLCSYACTIEKAFQRHLRAHARGNATPETRVSCAVCGADRSSEVDLSRHMRRHRDDRYFCCDICVFRTVQLKKLIQHRRMHTGEKPHLCPHCAYRSARRDNLRSHVRRVHKKENLYCDTFSPRGMLVERFPSQELGTTGAAISLSPPSSPPPTPTPPSSVKDGVDG